MQNWQLRVDEIPDPVPQAGQVLTRVLACGICGSDLHMLRHGAEARRLTDQLAEGQPADPLRPLAFDPTARTVMGHEFCCEVIDTGPDVERLSPGDVVVGVPAAFDARGVHTLGYSNAYPGGYAEMMVLNEAVALDVPNGLEPSVAAMTEPYAVGVHAVAKSSIAIGDAAIVLGLGPVGLAASPTSSAAASAPSSAPTSRCDVGSSPSTSAATSSSTRTGRRRSMRGARSTACGHSSSSRLSACPA